jgi:hypothetical protein
MTLTEFLDSLDPDELRDVSFYREGCVYPSDEIGMRQALQDRVERYRRNSSGTHHAAHYRETTDLDVDDRLSKFLGK